MAFFSGDHQILMNNLTQDDFDEIKVNGVKVFNFCHGLIRTVFHFWKTKNMFPTSHQENMLFATPSNEAENISKEFLEEYGFEFIKRNNTLIHLDQELIKNGDLFTAYGLNGGHPLIMFGTGGRAAHNAVAMWIEGELYILEASVKI